MEKKEVNNGISEVDDRRPRKYGSQGPKAERRISKMVGKGYLGTSESNHSRKGQEDKDRTLR